MTRPLTAIVFATSIHLLPWPAAAGDENPGNRADLPPSATEGETHSRRPETPVPFLSTLRNDYASFYSGRRLLTLGAAFAAGGLIANSDADESLYDSYRGARGERSDAWAHRTQRLGDADLVLPAVLLPALVIGLGDRPEESLLGAWWRRSARAYAVGGPAFYYLQQISGGSRPGEPEGSAWRPFVGNHGISGHTFLAGVPLLTAARLSKSPLARGSWIALSLVPAAARMEQGQHYPSQVALGWVLAWQATGAVADSSSRSRRDWVVAPVSVPGGGGLVIALSVP